ncbi:UvrD/REP helicase [Catovirus CTV1]|uniref:DNA 3'-5' helicase n=1 Tax=Catovirus CTV1 TaxID=1977631 RepID=A0A1V0SAV1_9VIRU|nr:UvrD/REP helicase [Catovirus CTV1]
MPPKRNINTIKEKIAATKLAKVTGLKKAELINLEKKIDLYMSNKNDNYKDYIINDRKVGLNDEQFKIVTDDINKNIRILACAGSGKTTTIICRIKYLIDKGVDPSQILLTTFNVDAAQNMKNKLESLFGFMPNILVGTFDGIACKYYHKFFKKDYHVGISEYATYFLEYLKSGEGHNVYDSIKYIFFDEFQDCSNIQFQILREFGKHNIYITVIGDDAQNIYQWRGSNIDYILNFDKYINDVTTHKLVNNYRSTPEIIDMSNLSIKNNTDQIPKDMISNNPSVGFMPEVRKYTNDVEQAEYVISKIASYVRDGIKLDEIAVISRNNYPLKIIEEQIEKHNRSRRTIIPYVALITEDNTDTKPKILEDHITLTSIHKSKGLEWQVVFLVSCNDDKFPSELDKISIQEERRLFYVCLTRAKKHLHISFTSKTVSRFIAEIPLDKINFIAFRNSYYNFQNTRNLKYKNDVTSLIEMIEPADIEKLRQLEILPEILPTITTVHESHEYDEIVNKYYLHKDFGIFIDRYISRSIGVKNKESDGLRDRVTEKIIHSLKMDMNLYSVYNKYQTNFSKKMSLINEKTLVSEYIEKLNKNNDDPIYIKKIEEKDMCSVREIVRQMYKRSFDNKVNMNEVVVIPLNYLPEEFGYSMRNSYKNYTDPNLDNKSIIKDIYRMSLCENINDGRRRLLYKDVSSFFIKDDDLFNDIEEYVNNIKDNKLLCKRMVKSQDYDIIGEMDLLDMTECKIIDYKCSVASECKLEWILQLLTYLALLRLEDNAIEINNIEFYNPLLGTIATIDVSKWNKEELLLTKLCEIRERNLGKRI